MIIFDFEFWSSEFSFLTENWLSTSLRLNIKSSYETLLLIKVRFKYLLMLSFKLFVNIYLLISFLLAPINFS
jgi:hypothetical protein